MLSRRRDSPFCTATTSPPAEAGACFVGRVLVFNHTRLEVIVWDSVIGDRNCVPAPPEVGGKEMEVCHGAVLCVADDLHHVHVVE
jgi:hypothetical protein